MRRKGISYDIDPNDYGLQQFNELQRHKAKEKDEKAEKEGNPKIPGSSPLRSVWLQLPAKLLRAMGYSLFQSRVDGNDAHYDIRFKLPNADQDVSVEDRKKIEEAAIKTGRIELATHVSKHFNDKDMTNKACYIKL